MGRGIDAARHPTGDGQAGVGEIARDALRDGEAVGGGAARSHHAEAEGLQEFDASAGEQEDRRIEDSRSAWG